jgi:uncharacterized membrane protein YkoI
MRLEPGTEHRAMRFLVLVLLSASILPLAAQPVRDHERARAAQARGEFVPLERILADAERREPGTVIDVELEDAEYEIEILRADGVVVELEYDARDGRFLESEIEDGED